MNVAFALFMVWIIAAGAQTAAWIWQRRHRNAGIVDVTWAATVAAGALVLSALGDGAGRPRITLAILGVLWGGRLALHLARRVFRDHEDGRYARLRLYWGNSDVKWLAFFQAQAVLGVLFSVPFLGAARNPITAPTLAWFMAIVWWLACVAGESIADRQLARYRADPDHAGKTCRAGLWRYSRHPNYFFEWLHWFAYVWLAAGSPSFAAAWAGPVVMYIFLRWVSGIPYTERQALHSRGDDYRDYQRTTSMLFPWFPKSRA